MQKLALPFSKAVNHLEGESAFEVLSKATRLESRGKNIIHLEIGQPDFGTPSHVSRAAMKAIRGGDTKYSPPLGIQELRNAVALHIKKTRGVKVSSRMVAITPSAKTAIYLAMTAIIERGDEVVYPDPGFPAYKNIINFLGGIPKPFFLGESGIFNKDLFLKAISSKTKLIILNSPNNPTGMMLSDNDLRFIYLAIRKYHCWVLSDEIYSQIIYSDHCPSFYSLHGAVERTILIDGFSKSYAMTGWRLGYLVLPETYLDRIENLIINSFGCTSSFVQRAGVAALTGPQNAGRKMVVSFKKRRDFIVEKLNAVPGISCQIPDGAFYVFPNIKKLGMGSQQIVDYLLEKAGVAVLSGAAFGENGEGHIRISYATSLNNLKRAMQRIREVVARL